MQVLVTGSDGQLGVELTKACATAGDEVIACCLPQFDLRDRDSVYSAISGVRPEVVFHLAAWTAVDACESEPERAFHVNALGSEWVADACRRSGAHLVAVSTDYVFDGAKPTPYHEWDQPNPQSVYGQSKLAGEQAVIAHAPGAAIVRTAWMSGSHGHNVVKTVLGLVDRPELAFVDDQRGSPTFAADLAPMIRRIAAERRVGVHHVTNQGETSWHGFAQDILELTGHDPRKVRPISTAQLDPPRPAPRPANSVLDNAALRLGGLPLLPHYRDSLARLLQELGARAK